MRERIVAGLSVLNLALLGYQALTAAAHDEARVGLRWPWRQMTGLVSVLR